MVDLTENDLLNIELRNARDGDIRDLLDSLRQARTDIQILEAAVKAACPKCGAIREEAE